MVDCDRHQHVYQPVRGENTSFTRTSILLLTLPKNIELALFQETRIAPSQTRIIPFKLTQPNAVEFDRLEFTLQLQSSDSASTEEIHVSVPVKQHARWTSSEATFTALKATYFFGTSMPTAFLAVPPAESPNGTFVPPILALR